MPKTSPQQPLHEFPHANEGYALGSLPFERPSWGCGDLRETVFECRFPDGSEAYSLQFDAYTIHDEILQPEHMPLVHLDDDSVIQNTLWKTLCIRLVDLHRPLHVALFYAIHPDCPCLFRWTRISNNGAEPLFIRNPESATFDLPGAKKDLLYLFGSWARERHVQRTPLSAGLHQISASNGASSHKTSPFIALLDQHTNEHSGEALGFALGYSGNFQASCSLDEHEQCRISIGIYKFHKTLSGQESIDTPMAVLAHSRTGVNGLSHAYHQTIRTVVSPPRWRETPRKIIINSWEAMYFDISEEKIVELAENGKRIGAELLVLDDGWFSRRRDDTSSLGDWWVNTTLFPNGLDHLAKKVREVGLDFGIWVEPEMISPNSTLFTQHPEWAIQIAERPLTQARNQYVLDLSNPAVQEYILDRLTAIFSEVRPNYVKWDMNRNMTEPASSIRSPEEQGSFMHAYMLGFYAVFGTLQKRFPDILFESCAGGGGRFDLGLAYYFPRFWTSDQTDAIERLPIQYGTSIVFPPEMMGSHVSPIPTHQAGRTPSITTRALTALAYSYGYELNPKELSAEESDLCRQFSEQYVQERNDFHSGIWYRLLGPLQSSQNNHSTREISSEYAWMISANQGERLYIFYARPLKPGVMLTQQLALPPINNDRWSSYTDSKTDKTYNAAYLKHQGLRIPDADGDYHVVFWKLIANKAT